MVHGSGREAMAYGSKDKTRFRDLKRGDVLWVIASSRDCNPSLVAKIVVDASGDRTCTEVRRNPSARALLQDRNNRFPYVVTGGEGSHFFGFNDAGHALLDLTLLTGTGCAIRFREKSDEWKGQFGHYLQRPIKIADSSTMNALELLAERCRAGTIFISWKHLDHPRGRFPREIAYSLVERGFAVWFDLLALPPSKYLEGIRRNPAVLANLLGYGYRQSHYLLAIESENYGTHSPNSDRNWTLEEWEGSIDANNCMKRICIPVPEDKKSKMARNADHTIRSNLPAEIACSFSLAVNHY